MNHHNVESHLLRRRARTSGSLAARAYDWQEAARLERYERETANLFAMHVTCSELDRQRLMRIAPNIRCCVVPNGVDVEYFESKPRPAPDPTFAFVGTLGWGPNREAAEILCRELWPAVVAEWPHARMYLVGANPPRCARELAARDRRFVVTGFADDVRPYMAESSFFLCPIKEGGGTKLKILNAMAMGKVVIADPVACEGINVTSGSEVVLAASANDYVHAVRALLGDPERYAQVVKAARRRVEMEYAYDVIGRDLDRLYRAAHESFASR
jgi:glycosyltransferase involved in cell wall biosynthesis